jgi:Beta-lactamase/LysM domain
MRSELDAAVRKLVAQASGDQEFANLLSVAPTQAVKQAVSITERERRLLYQTSGTWVSHLSGRKWLDALSAPQTRGSRSGDLLASVTRATINLVRHVVKPGETLTSISATYTGCPDRWRQLRDMNALRDPPRPGTPLIIPSDWAAHFGNITLSAAELDVHMNRPIRTQDSQVQRPPYAGTGRSGAIERRRPPKPWAGPATTSDLQLLVQRVALEAAFASGTRGVNGVQGMSIQGRQNGLPSVVDGENVTDIAFGYARGLEQSHPLLWSSNVQMDIGSVSKFITAISVLQCLYNQRLSPDELVYPWIPNYWTKGQNNYLLTFDDFLTHRTGWFCNTLVYSFPGSEFDIYKGQVAVGTNEYDVGSYNPDANSAYYNENFGFMRVILPSLIGDTIFLSAIYEADPSFSTQALDNAWDAVTKKSFAALVNESVFAPCGITREVSMASDSNSALAYVNGGIFAGIDIGDLSDLAGFSGWYLSVNEVLDVANGFRRENLLTGGQAPSGPDYWYTAQGALDSHYGIDGIFSQPASGCPAPEGAYTYYNKNGDQYASVTFAGRTFATLVQAEIWLLPNEIEVVLFANSVVGPPSVQYSTGLQAQSANGAAFANPGVGMDGALSSMFFDGKGSSLCYLLGSSPGTCTKK